MDETVQVTIIILPSGIQVQASIPKKATGKMIIQKLVDTPNLNVQKTDYENNPATYVLWSKDNAIDIRNETVEECGVTNGGTLILQPSVIAG